MYNRSIKNNGINQEVVVYMKQKVNLSLDESVAEKLKYLAKSSNRTVSQWVTDRVLDELSKQSRDKDKNGE